MGAIAILPLLLKLVTNKYVWIGLGVAAAVVAFLFYRSSLIHEGEAKAKAAYEAATQAEQARENKINQDWQVWAAGANANADNEKAKFDELQKQTGVASAANDRKPGLDAAAVARLRAFGRSGQASPNSTHRAASH
jgi:hypothetical protein